MRSRFTAFFAVTWRYDRCSLSMIRVSATTKPALASACWIVSQTSFEEFENSTVIHRPGFRTRWNSLKHCSISLLYSDSVRVNLAARPVTASSEELVQTRCHDSTGIARSEYGMLSPKGGSTKT